MEKLNRRTFLKKAAIGTAGVASAGLLGACAPEVATPAPEAPAAPGAVAPAASEGSLPSFLTPPAPIADSEIAETVEADVVIVGCGLAGLCAARSAVESGATVAVIEKATTFQYRSGQIGTFNSKIHQKLGMDFDATGAVGALMKEMGYRPDQRVWNLWRDYSGEAFDWYLKPATDKDLVDTIDCFATTYDETRITIVTLHHPYPEEYDVKNEFSPVYPEATLSFMPDQGAILKMSYDIAVEKGVDFHFSTWAKQLVRPNNEGRVLGVIAEDMEGKKIKFLAKKGVIMAAGDYGSDPDMVKYYCGGRGYFGFFPNVDAKGVVTNTGDGQKMGIWAGAMIDDGPHAPMTHTLGAALGCDPFLLLNTSGDRFCNEDVAGQQLSTQLFRQRDNFAWYIFDDDYPDQLKYMPVGHGSVNYVLPEAENPHLKNVMSIGKAGTTSREEVDGQCTKAATLEELFKAIELTPEAQATALASVARYNELCDNGVDEDFNKMPSRLFAVKKAPFYASKVSAGAMLVCIGGLKIDPVSMRVLDPTQNPIDGLYAAGNNMGGRIVQDYPVTVPGVSHGTAITFGYLAGKKAAEAPAA